MNLEILIVGKVNVIRICQSKYDLSPVPFFFSFIAKVQNVPN